MKFLSRAVIASLLLMGAAAHADVVSFFVDEGNDCSGIYGLGFENCTIGGIGEEGLSSIILKIDVEEGLSINSLYSDFDYDDLSFSGISEDAGIGSWSYDMDATVGIRFWVAKASNGFNVFYDIGSDDLATCGAIDTNACMSLASLSYSGSWMTPLNKKGLPRGLSHLSFYDSEVRLRVPEPGTLTLLGLGLIGLGAARRRRVR